MSKLEYLLKLISTIELVGYYFNCHEKANVLTIAKYTAHRAKNHKKCDIDTAITRCEQFIIKQAKATYTKNFYIA